MAINKTQCYKMQCDKLEGINKKMSNQTIQKVDAEIAKLIAETAKVDKELKWYEVRVYINSATIT